MDDKTIKMILLSEGYVEKEELEKGEAYVKEQGGSLVDYLFEEKLMTKEIFGQALGEFFKVPFIDLAKVKIDEKALHLVPELVAREKGIIAFGQTDEEVKLGMISPDDLEIKQLIEKKTGKRVKPYFITTRDLKFSLEDYGSSLKEKFDQIFKQIKDKTLSHENRDELIVRMVDILLRYGQQNKASDIHIEPLRYKVIVRFRIDGVMHDALDIPKEFLESILTRIKILAKMRTDEHRAAQDGKLRFAIGEEVIDIRVSIVPVTGGENIVMRLLSAKSRKFDLAGLGLLGNDLKKVKAAIRNPHGMILVTGPTGSGKTTTLYAVMKILNKREIYISTIEDPVEYDIEGVSQIQVNPKTNLTFAKGLRSIVRQDPDIIMVGEIRDSETANIAINSAMTGHLVLSTLHANDAATTLPRLLDMGIEPFLVASTVRVSIAQRLVREICTKCRASYALSKEEKRIIKERPKAEKILLAKGRKDISKLRSYKGNGCKVCAYTGYIGRIGIFEALEMADNIKDLIMKRAPSGEIMKVAQENGMTTMFEDGIEKVLAGITTLEEVMRVTGD